MLRKSILALCLVGLFAVPSEAGPIRKLLGKLRPGRAVVKAVKVVTPNAPACPGGQCHK